MAFEVRPVPAGERVRYEQLRYAVARAQVVAALAWAKEAQVWKVYDDYESGPEKLVMTFHAPPTEVPHAVRTLEEDRRQPA